MDTKDSIKELLEEIKVLYEKTNLQSHKIFYSKLALLELCGWIEETIDKITLNYAKPKLKSEKNIEFLEKDIVKKTYGFDYNLNFRQMLVKIIGIINVEKLEKKLVEIAVFEILVAQLGSLSSLRNTAAHTTSTGTMRTYEAPSTMIKYLDSLYPIFEKFEVELNKL